MIYHYFTLEQKNVEFEHALVGVASLCKMKSNEFAPKFREWIKTKPFDSMTGLDIIRARYLSGLELFE